VQDEGWALGRVTHHETRAETRVSMDGRRGTGNANSEEAEDCPGHKNDGLVFEVAVRVTEVLPGFAEDGGHVERRVGRARTEPRLERLAVLV
jgi:hypothetical protein